MKMKSENLKINDQKIKFESRDVFFVYNRLILDFVASFNCSIFGNYLEVG